MTVCTTAILIAATGCGASEESTRAEQASGAQKVSPEVSAEPTPAEARATKAPEPILAGLHAPVVWSPPPKQPRPEGAVCGLGEGMDQLSLTQIRADQSWLYLDVKHSTSRPEEEGHPGAPASVRVFVDGCPYREPRVSGTVWRGWASPSTLTLSLSDLPDGDLTLIASAFGSRAMTLLHKQGNAIASLRGDQRKGYRVIPGDPARGIEPMVTIDHGRDCGKWGAP